jgi:hypothetical protein
MRSSLIGGWGLVGALLAASLAGCDRRIALGPQADVAAALKLRESLAGGTPAGAAEEPTAPEAQQASGWATLRGTFKYVGSAPTPEKLVISKDPEVCGKHNLVDESLSVSPGGELANVVIFVRSEKVPVNPEYEKSAQDKVILDNRNCRFEPHIQFVRTTQTLVIKNSDPVGHNSKLDPARNSPTNANLPVNESASQTFPKEESLPVRVGCSIHPWMGGYVVARSNPYAAVSDAKGNFTLANLPAGIDLEFQLWHEKTPNLKGVQLNGPKVDGKGRFKLKLQPGEDMNLEIKVPAASLK